MAIRKDVCRFKWKQAEFNSPVRPDSQPNENLFRTQVGGAVFKICQDPAMKAKVESELFAYEQTRQAKSVDRAYRSQRQAKARVLSKARAERTDRETTLHTIIHNEKAIRANHINNLFTQNPWVEDRTCWKVQSKLSPKQTVRLEKLLRY